MVAPDLIDIEVLSTLRRLAHQKLVSVLRAEMAVADLEAAPIRRLSALPLLAAIWRYRDNLSVYDAAYVALADAFGCRLITSDARLARAPRLPVQVIVP